VKQKFKTCLKQPIKFNKTIIFAALNPYVRIYVGFVMYASLIRTVNLQLRILNPCQVRNTTVEFWTVINFKAQHS